MATYINHVTVAAPRNGTNSHTVDPSSGVAVAGTPFTPTAGNLLVCIAEGPVTSTTPTGWTLPAGGSAINNTGLYVWYRVAAGGDSITTTHNGSNRPVVFDFYEFPASSAFLAATSATNVAGNCGAGPSLSGLDDPANFRAAAVGQNRTNAVTASFTWSVGIEGADTSVAQNVTDGYAYSLSYLEDETGATYSSAATSTDTSTSCERLVFAIDAAEVGTTYEIGGTSEAVSVVEGQPVAVLNIEGDSPAVSTVDGSFGGVYDISGETASTSAVQGSFGIATEPVVEVSSAFPLIERVARSFIRQRYPVIAGRVGGDNQYILGEEPYVQVQLVPGGGTTQLQGEWAVDVAVFDDNYARAAEIANDLEALLLSTKGARHEGMIIDRISQNQTPSRRPSPDKRIFEMGTIYVFEARRRS